MLNRLMSCPDGQDCLVGGSCRHQSVCRFADLSDFMEATHRFVRGDRVPTASRPGEVRLHIVRSGMVAASVTMSDGRRQILHFLVPGDVICSLDVAEADCCAEALMDTETCELILPAQLSDSTADPTVPRALFDLSHDLLGRFVGHVVQLGRFDGTERVCAFLLDMAQRTGLRRKDGWYLTLPMSRDDIADHLGLNAATVSRILSRIKRDGIARFRSPTECEICDLDRLRARVPVGGRVAQNVNHRPGQEFPQ